MKNEKAQWKLLHNEKFSHFYADAVYALYESRKVRRLGPCSLTRAPPWDVSLVLVCVNE
jgi:hypothetical protein